MNFSVEAADALVGWYSDKKRALPWRDTGNPYDVWLSEIMLQQTRIAFVWNRFILFKQTLPDIQSLARCPDDQLMKLWEGMGYYSRARNLKKTAVLLTERYQGQFPSSYQELCALPGIGPYTAGAIGSIAFNQPTPAIDGNVLRVLARWSADERDIRNDALKEEYRLAVESVMLSRQNEEGFCSNLSQALMELGEVICTPNGIPKCNGCPLASSCKAFLNDTVMNLPVRSSLKARRIEKRTVLVLRNNDGFYLQKRPETGLLAGLYEFPSLDGCVTNSELLTYLENEGYTPVKIKNLPEGKHIFTHLEWHMRVREITVADPLPEKENGRFLTLEEMKQTAVPSAFRFILDYYR